MIKKLFCIFLCLWITTPVFAQSDVIREVFDVVQKDYAGKTTNHFMALKGLQSLSQIDPQINIKEQEGMFVLKKSEKIIQKFNLPSSEADSSAWTALCKNIISVACRHSEKLDVADFELPDRFAAAVLNDLDGHSHYFSVFSENEEEQTLKIKRPFASRVIDNILLIRLLTFKKGISEQVKTAVFECSKCEGIILDLRGNKGGFFNEAIQIADLFLDEGIITYTLSDKNGIPQYYSADTGDMTDGKPMVILVDGSTASAAEVLAGALSEQNRAVLIGTKTYGKGSVQDVKKMDKDRAMAVTSTYFYTPSGLKIDKIGLSPQICVAKSENCDGEDRFSKEEDIERAVLYLKTGL